MTNKHGSIFLFRKQDCVSCHWPAFLRLKMCNMCKRQPTREEKTGEVCVEKEKEKERDIVLNRHSTSFAPARVAQWIECCL